MKLHSKSYTLVPLPREALSSFNQTKTEFMAIDLDSYFKRIGYTGPRTPTLDTLRALHALHPDAIPFESLSPLLGHQVRIDLDALQEKLVKAERGGYCFEHSRLFHAVLEALGFQTRPLAARVVWGLPDGELPPRLHMLLLVTIDGEEWIADVGFGVVTLSAPLRLETGLAQETPHEAFRLDSLEDGEYLLHAQLGDKWVPVYQFGLSTQCDADHMVANYYVSTHPESLFVHNLLAARVTTGARYSLFNGRVSSYTPQPSHREVANVAELREVLKTTFGIRLPDVDGGVSGADLDAALARCLENSQ